MQEYWSVAASGKPLQNKRNQRLSVGLDVNESDIYDDDFIV